MMTKMILQLIDITLLTASATKLDLKNRIVR
jgi:hypothetical protein